MNKGTFWLVWGVGFVPMFLAMMMYFGQVGVPDGRMNRGDLLQPGQELEDWEIRDASGEQWVYQGNWQLLLSYQQCTPKCAEWRDLMPNLHAALGREKDRVQWHTLSKSAEQGELVSDQLAQIGEGVWVADPLGNLVMHYPLQQSPRDVLGDLKRMLKLSRIG